ncbi:MAG: hypothetical protein V4736_07315 [Bdellovibrionota bacterium]
MKKLVVAIVGSVLVSQGAFAQGQSMSMQLEKPAIKGFYVGADYMNLTDIKVKATAFGGAYFRATGTNESKSEGGTHVGMAGVRLGYIHPSPTKFAIGGGVRLIESFNRSEWGDSKVQIVMPEANLIYSFTEKVNTYGGINYAKFTGSSAANEFKPQLGLQAGLGMKFTRAISANAGYTMMGETIEDDRVKMEFVISGFNTNVNYSF